MTWTGIFLLVLPVFLGALPVLWVVTVYGVRIIDDP